MKGAPLAYLDVCSGYSAPTLAWQGLPLECIAYAEIDPAPSAVLAHRWGAGCPRAMPSPEAVVFPDGMDAEDAELFERLKRKMRDNEQDFAEQEFVRAWKERHQRRSWIAALPKIKWGERIRNFGDFTTIGDRNDTGQLDLLIGGTPCQGFSIAGQRLGLADPRGHLTLEFLALAKRLRPRWFIWENVPGFLSIDGGRAMGTFARLLGELGYGWAYRVLDAQYARVDGLPRAVPQRRERLFVVGYLGSGACARAVLFDRRELRWDSPPRREAGKGIAGALAARAGGGGWPDGGDGRADHLIPAVAHSLRAEGFDASEDGSQRGTPIVPVDVAPTLRAGGNKGGGDRPPGTDVDTVESLIPIQMPAEVAQPLRSGGEGSGHVQGSCADTAATGLIPIHVPEVCPQSVSSKWAKGSSGPAGDETANLVAFSQKDFGQDATEGLSPTLRGMGANGSHANAGGQVAIAFPNNMSSTQHAAERDVAPNLQAKNPTAVAFDTTQITHPENRSNPKPGDPCHSIPKTGHAPSIAFQERGREGGRSLEWQEGLSYSLNSPAGGGRTNEFNVATAQGRYRVRRLTPRECERLQGVPDDYTLVPFTRGKPMADGPRYKMIGNSQATNVMRWLGLGIVAVEAILREKGLVD